MGKPDKEFLHALDSLYELCHSSTATSLDLVEISKIIKFLANKSKNKLKLPLKQVKQKPEFPLENINEEKQNLTGSLLDKRLTVNIRDSGSEYDVVEASALHGLLNERYFQSEAEAKGCFKVLEMLFKAGVSPNDVQSLFIGGNTGKFIKLTAFEMALELLDIENNEQEDNEDGENNGEQLSRIEQIKIDILKTFIEHGVDVTQAQKAYIQDDSYKTLAHMPNWHLAIRKSYLPGLQYYLTTTPDKDLDLEIVSITSMRLFGVKHADLCTKAIHLAGKVSDEYLAFYMVRLLLDKGAKVNSFSLRTEEEDEGLGDNNDSEAGLETNVHQNHMDSSVINGNLDHDLGDNNSDDSGSVTSNEEEKEREVIKKTQIKFRCVETCLHIAIKRQHLALVLLLMMHGADKNIPFIQCPLDDFPVQSCREVLEQEFDLPEFKKRKNKSGIFKYEEVCKQFIKKPYDQRALIGVDKLVEYYVDDERAKSDMFSILNKMRPAHLDEYFKSFGI